MYDQYIAKLEAQTLRPHVIQMNGKIPIDHADEIKGAQYYIGSNLVARQPITIYSRPIDGKPLRTIPAGANVGHIFSYVDNTPDGSLWWQLDGTNGVGGFVRHGKGLFDIGIAIGTASGAEHEKTLAELDALSQSPESKLGEGVASVFGGVGNALKGFGDNLNMIIILVLILAAGVAMYKLFKM